MDDLVVQIMFRITNLWCSCSCLPSNVACRTLDAKLKISAKMVCDTTDQIYQSMLTKCSILPRYAENRPAKPKDPRQQSTKV